MHHLYFDHNATSPVAPQVLRAYSQALEEVHGNASSIHRFGQAAKQRLEDARRQLAATFDCDPHEVVFTSGGTESDNLAVFGVARGLKDAHVIASSVEHPAVQNACSQLEREGASVTWLPVSSQGLVDPDDVRRAIRPRTALITVMHANNETGAMQPVTAIAEIAREAGIPFHTDAVQTAGRISFSMRGIGADLVSVGGHKFGAPKGVGALLVRKGIRVNAQLFGGHHERDRRAGTESVPATVALANAAGPGNGWDVLANPRDRLERAILDTIPGTYINGGEAPRLPNTSNIRFEGVGGEAMVIALDLRGFAVSSGSACSSGAVEASHVLLSMGQSREQARSSVRFSLGPGTTAQEIDLLIGAVQESAAHLRRISPAKHRFPEPANAG